MEDSKPVIEMLITKKANEMKTVEKFREKILEEGLIVIKGSGKKLDYETLREIAELKTLNHVRNLVFVHGGGVQIDGAMREVGIEIRAIGGYRVTCERTMGIVELELLKILQMVGKTLSDCGASTALFCEGIFRGELMDEKTWGRYGTIRMTDYRQIVFALAEGKIPVVCPIGADAAGGIFNLDADECAASLGVALNAKEAILVTDVGGIMLNNGIVKNTDALELEKFLENGTVNNGMIPKAKACIQGARAGVVMKIVGSGILDAVHATDGNLNGTLVKP